MSFSCGCGKIFKSDGDIYSHKIEKLACSTCQYCGHRFQGRYEIREHMKAKHLDFTCRACPRKLFLFSGRKNHEEMKHGRHYIFGMDEAASAMSSLTMNPRTSETGFILELRECGSFEELLTRNVYPDPEKIRKCNEVVEHLMLFLQQKYTIGEVVKGGSLGKGTSIKAKVDIDLSVFMNDFGSVADLQRNMRPVLKNLHDHILQDANWAEEVKFTRYTAHSIQFSLKTNPGDEMNEVDLLPACDLGTGPRRDIFDRMAPLSNYEKSFYSVCLAKDQIEFVRRVPGNVKDLIRMVKHWKRIEQINVVSYCIELIVIRQWKDWGEPDRFDLGTRFKQIMGVMSSLGSIQITWPSRYDISSYGGLPRAPAVMDPANPFINVAARIQGVAEIEGKAREVYHRI